MKKQLSLVGVILLITVIVFTAVARQKENKGQGKEKDKQENKGKGPEQKEKKDDQGKRNDKDLKENKGNNKNNGSGKNDDHDNRSYDKGNSGKMKDGFVWNTETFRDRDKMRKQDKVTICHKINRNNEPPVTLRVSANALNAHLAHGDVQGECAGVNNNLYSDGFLQRRTDYYTTLQNSQEQVVYSRSILDYALERLTNARSQLVLLQRSNAPQADIQRKQVMVTELEQNVSLLDQLIGITANLLVNKLVN